MITYHNCSEVDISLAYRAFTVGFSDYIVKMDHSQDLFISRFFGAEGNQLEYSYIAMDEDKPIGLILGGLKWYEGVLTMRCGTLAVHPDYRGTGVSSKLFELHKANALACECKQLFLEVIVGNNRAIQFYKKLGYRKVYDLRYYTLHQPLRLTERKVEGLVIKPIAFDSFEHYVQNLRIEHINWQNDLDYMKRSENNTYAVAYLDDMIIGTVCMSDSGKVSFLYVDAGYRHQGIATSMLAKLVEEKQPERLSISFPNNHQLEGFLRSQRFEKNQLEQFEMYCFCE
ncbi:GNAT family N-acetyltransferase [Paenibacillus sp.]|uniref:GNAT family N-acetyltransferase n=1 Tax=Paenibacillus sp. TaxID=58172 RepID=UPI003463EDE1